MSRGRQLPIGTCVTCKREGLDDEHDFCWRNTKHGRKRDGRCKECKRKQDREYYATHAEHIQKKAYERKTEEQKVSARKRTKAWLAANPERRYVMDLAFRLRRKYKLSLVAYLCAFEQQGGKCARCRSATWGRNDRKPSVDHDHITMRFRGLLCLWCNQMLGHLGDNSSSVEREAQSYINYLEGRL